MYFKTYCMKTFVCFDYIWEMFDENEIMNRWARLKRQKEQMKIKIVGVLSYLNLTITSCYLTRNLNKHKSIMWLFTQSHVLILFLIVFPLRVICLLLFCSHFVKSETSTRLQWALLSHVYSFGCMTNLA